MSTRLAPLGSLRCRIAAVIAVALLATLLSPAASTAAAQGDRLVTQAIVGKDSNRVWKSLQDGTDQGSAWRQVGFDDSAWTNTPMKFYAPHGTVPNDGRGYYFREEFTLTEVHQIVAIDLDLYYDDAAVLFINGVEVYRSIRNNLPTTNSLSIIQTIPFGGAENYYVQIPAATNYCEQGCLNGGAVAAIDPSVLQEGANSFAIMAWTTPNSDLGIDLAFDVQRNPSADAPASLEITEVVGSNDESLADEDDDHPDWFELHNPGSQPVSLAGWTIEDAAGRWSFPNVTIAPDDYLVVFASDKDRSPTDGSPLHTNFKISKEADELRLIDGDDIVQSDTGPLPRMLTDVSLGIPAGGDEIGYLASTTPGATNSNASATLSPVLRPFSGRLFNLGDPVQLRVDAFDPDDDPISYSMSQVPGMSIDSETGEITGKASTPGTFTSTVTVGDATGRSASQEVVFLVLEAPTASASLVLNEYNAVPPDRELSAGADITLGPALGNGGDWYEFLVVEDGLDLRGWTIELWDRDRDDDLMDQAATLKFNDDFRLAYLPAGMLITISESFTDDFRFNRASGDWHINLQANNDGEGDLFDVQENFNSTRSDQHVILRDASGTLRSPAVGETEAWDSSAGGVSGGEVMNLCIDPTVSTAIDPVAHYRDNATTSTFGRPNRCVYANPADPAAAQISFNQQLTGLRGAAVVRGDADCDGTVTINDARMVSLYAVGFSPAALRCLEAADVDGIDVVTNNDAAVLTRCVIGEPDHRCPHWN